MTNSCKGKTATKFPDGDLWGWSTGWTTDLDKLGQIIMAAQNPYCRRPGSSGSTCDPLDAATWPQQLTNENTWKVLTEFDFLGASWTFQNSPKPIKRSMRIPYLIAHRVAQHGPNKQVFGRENLLVGFGEDSSVSIAGAMPWNGPTSCPGTGQIDAVGLLAEFITMNMMRNGDTAGFRVPNWDQNLPANTDNSDAVAWSFRQAVVKLDYPFRFPVAVGRPGNPQTGGWIYVGYEGGGAY